MIARAIAAEVRFAWVLGDESDGFDRRQRIDLEQQERAFVVTIRSNEKLWSTLDDDGPGDGPGNRMGRRPG